MEKFVLEIEQDAQKLSFEIIDYAHHDGDQCKFELFQENKLVASFEPDKHGYLHICKNPGRINEDTLHQIAEKIESYNW